MKQAMVFAAGLGTRLKPLTDTMPKALVKVGGFALLQHNISKLKANGYEHIVVNIHHLGQQIIDFIAKNDNFGIDIQISDERSQLLDTGGGLKKARMLFNTDSPILIHNVDILSDLDLQALTAQAAEKAASVLAISERESASGRYLLFDKELRLIGWTNTHTREIRSPFEDATERTAIKAPFAGIHVFQPSMFELMNDWPDKFSIMDFYLKVCKESPIYGVYSRAHILDVGKADSLTEAEQFLKMYHATNVIKD